jgi:hypothetical protein
MRSGAEVRVGESPFASLAAPMAEASCWAEAQVAALKMDG